MCGILGYILPHSHTEDAMLASAMESLSHRGPDARGYFRQDALVMAHLRLSILDLSDNANQPMHSHCDRYVMVYNGEVYNYREVQQEIQKQNPSFQPRTHSDSEVLVEAFALWNIAFVHKLNGMFAIAIWDKLEKTLYLFRDRIGIKPLYYYHRQQDFAFASELKALTHHPAISKQLSIDYTAVNQFLHLGYIPAPYSIYEEIKKFPQGHFGVFKNGKLTLEPYWRLEDKARSENVIKDPQEALEQLRELVETSVKYRLISDVPYGTFLSGGVDSSLVSAVAQSLHAKPINTFSIGFWEKDFDETPWARKIAQHLGTNHHEFMVTEKDALEWMPKLDGIYDEPYADSSAIPTLLVSQMAKKHVTMTLSGDGGDELFMGYGAYKWAQRLSHACMPLLRKPASLLLKAGPVQYRRAAALFENPGKERMKSHIFSQEQYLFSRREIARMLQPQYGSAFMLDENYGPELSHLNAQQQQALFDMKYYLPDDLLVKVDRASMFFALETRVPLLDYRIVEWSMNVHPNLKIKNGEAKWLLKQLLYQYVPAEHFQRPKRGFAIPLQKWLKTELRDYAMDYLNPEALNKTQILNPGPTQQLLDSFYKKDQHYLYNRIWQLVVLQKWLSENTR